jgi:hypothetical protein
MTGPEATAAKPVRQKVPASAFVKYLTDGQVERWYPLASTLRFSA